jgi:hypothetical protein
MKPNINSVEVHPHLSNSGHPVDGALVGAGFTVALKEIRVFSCGKFSPLFDLKMCFDFELCPRFSMKKMTQICPDLGNEGTTKQIARFLQQVLADSRIMEGCKKI